MTSMLYTIGIDAEIATQNIANVLTPDTCADCGCTLTDQEDWLCGPCTVLHLDEWLSETCQHSPSLCEPWDVRFPG